MMRVCCLLAILILGSNGEWKDWVAMYHGPASNGGLYQIGCNATIPRRPANTTWIAVSTIEFYYTPVGGKRRLHTSVDMKDGPKDGGANLVLYSYRERYANLLWSSGHYWDGKLDGEWLCIVYGHTKAKSGWYAQTWYSCGKTKVAACDWTALEFHSLVEKKKKKKISLQSKCPVVHLYDPGCGNNCKGKCKHFL